MTSRRDRLALPFLAVGTAVTSRPRRSLLLAGASLVGACGAMAGAAVGTAAAAQAVTARPDGIYVATKYEALPAGRFPPQGEYVHVDVDKSAHHVTVAQACPGSGVRKMLGTIRADGTFAVTGEGVVGPMSARGRFVDPSQEHHFIAVSVTITNGCRAGTETWHAVAV
jgi:hypothetical protein